ncbi:S41 family peptidase [Winogradskyella eckloniae]|uniref:S41 family peptidase n=1 Tax=Winogradskyella eckloniae TaxID=1089306 RepID=UPI00156501CE|nr:S41 family peptidase [Winogradskyella eckloniae]NRD19000.1 S41 family peptidase [Winogradskyella eckloniae]
MRHLLIIFLLAITSNCSSSKEKVLTPKKYLNEVLEIVEKNSINRDSVDFKTIKHNALSKLSNTNTIEECYPIVQSILRELGDNHSFFMSKEQVKNWKSTSKSTEEIKLITFSGKLLKDNYGYIKMDGFSSGDSISIQKYADSLQNKIKSIDNKNIKGWILDLRENTGGNCWPMLTGIGPILGNGICGYFVDRKGNKSSWFYKNGESGINEFTITKVSHQPYELYDNTKPIAVLTGSKTGSSGEVVVTAFHNKEKTKSFGTKTYGVSTGNQNFDLSDGSMILLTTSIYADRKGIIFGAEIEPDEIVEFDYNSIGKQSDLVIQKAIEWINEKK